MPRTRDPNYRCDCGCVCGTPRAYRHLCGCTPCREANNAQNRAARKRAAYGRTRPMLDATETRIRLGRLSETMSLNAIARAAGVSKPTVHGLFHGHRVMVTAETRDRIFAVTAPVLLSGSLIDATGTRRRIQALAAAGWAPSIVQDMIGTRHGYVHLIMKRPQVTVTTARKVAAVYAHLETQSPPVVTTADRHRRSKALARAARNGWAPPDAWWLVDIDDPAAVPDAIAADEPGWVVTELDHLHGCGESAYVAVTALGREPAALAHMCRRHRRPDLARWVESVRRAA